MIVWNTETEQPSAPFTAHGSPVYCAAFSPEGDYVASAGYDNRVLVWRPADVQPFDYPYGKKNTAAKYEAFEGHTAAIRAIAFSPNGKMILSAGHDNTIKLWDFPGGHLVKSLRGHASWVRGAVFSPDGHWVLSGSFDAEAKLWSIAGYEEVRVFQDRVINSPAGAPVETVVGGEKHQSLPHADAILAAAFSRADGDHRVVTASRDRTAKTWNFDTGKMLASFEEGHEYLASTAIVFPDGMKLLTAAADNTTRVWDLTTGTQLYWLDRTGRTSVAAISHNGKLIATGSDDNTAKIWNAEAAGAGKKKNAEEAAVEVKPLRATKVARGGDHGHRFFARRSVHYHRRRPRRLRALEHENGSTRQNQQHAQSQDHSDCIHLRRQAGTHGQQRQHGRAMGYGHWRRAGRAEPQAGRGDRFNGPCRRRSPGAVARR